MATIILLVSIFTKTATLLSSEGRSAFVSDFIGKGHIKFNDPKIPTCFPTQDINSFKNFEVSRNRRCSKDIQTKLFTPSLERPIHNLLNDGGQYLKKTEKIDVLEGLDDKERNKLKRRSFLSNLAAAYLSVSAATSKKIPPAFALEIGDQNIFEGEGNGYRYSFLPPPNFKRSNKPLKTHLDEINFSNDNVKGYQFGITVDPVRIDNLRQFGTPEEVATRVVYAELNRDGVTDVSLFGEPREITQSGAYAIEYISTGKRGTKHYVTKIFVKEKHLYVLTAQVLEVDYKDMENEIHTTVDTFTVQ